MSEAAWGLAVAGVKPDSGLGKFPHQFVIKSFLGRQ